MRRVREHIRVGKLKLCGLLKKQIIFDLGGSEVMMSLGHVVGQVTHSFVQALSSSESACTVLGGSEIF